MFTTFIERAWLIIGRGSLLCANVDVFLRVGASAVHAATSGYCVMDALSELFFEDTEDDGIQVEDDGNSTDFSPPPSEDHVPGMVCVELCIYRS